METTTIKLETRQINNHSSQYTITKVHNQGRKLWVIPYLI